MNKSKIGRAILNLLGGSESTRTEEYKRNRFESDKTQKLMIEIAGSESKAYSALDRTLFEMTDDERSPDTAAR